MSFLNAMFPAPKAFEAPAIENMVVPRCDPSQHNTLRHEQVERRRKRLRKANRLKFKRYRRAK